MNFREWVETVPREITNDPLWNMQVYQQAMFLAEIAWFDTRKFAEHKTTVSLADQLNRAVGSISANIAEGYSRVSGRDQARFYEYALGSARESRGWYYQGRKLLGQQVFEHRMQLIESIIRQLMQIIPAKRGKKIKEAASDYMVPAEILLDNVPLPE